MPGVYTVTEQSIDKYVPQEVHRVTVVAGQVSKVNFNNVLKRGNLQVIKSSEDNLVEGVTFHLYGTSLSGIVVDEYDILDLGKQLMPIGMLVVLDSILNRITQNRAKGKQTFIFIDEIYLLFQHEYSANFLFTLWKRVRKYGAYATGITQNVDDLLQSHTARTMLANSEFLIMLNQASTDRIELAKLLNISDLQLSYITNVDAGHGLIKVCRLSGNTHRWKGSVACRRIRRLRRFRKATVSCTSQHRQ